MLKGVKDFRVNNPETRHFNDTAHRAANLLKAYLEKNPRWKEFRTQVTQARRMMQNSLVAGALPPSPRMKARYMNVDSLIGWGEDMLTLLDNEEVITEFDIKELKKYIGWLPEYRDEILLWNRFIRICATARHVIREEGIHANIVDSFEKGISSIGMSCKELEFTDQLSLFLLEQSSKLTLEERFIGSTEVLESFFGKLKYMEWEQKAFGFTSLVLATVACVGPTDGKTVEEAITTVKFSEIDAWTEREIGQSIQSQRRSMRKIIDGLTEKMAQKVSGFLERAAAGF